MGEKFDKLSKEDQAAVMTWAKHEAVLYSATVQNFGTEKRAVRATEQAEKVASDPERLKRVLAAVKSKGCQDDEYTYVLKGATLDERKKVDNAVDLNIGKLPDFLKDPRSCTVEDVQLSTRAIRQQDLPKTR